MWVSWSPGYMNGITVNGTKVFHGEGPRYDCYAHGVGLDDLSAFRRGRNTLATGASARGKHGMEVKWPGIMVLIQYREDG